MEAEGSPETCVSIYKLYDITLQKAVIIILHSQPWGSHIFYVCDELHLNDVGGKKR
jgi:hypothetical protein